VRRCWAISLFPLRVLNGKEKGELRRGRRRRGARTLGFELLRAAARNVSGNRNRKPTINIYCGKHMRKRKREGHRSHWQSSLDVIDENRRGGKGRVALSYQFPSPTEGERKKSSEKGERRTKEKRRAGPCSFSDALTSSDGPA